MIPNDAAVIRLHQVFGDAEHPIDWWWNTKTAEAQIDLALAQLDQRLADIHQHITWSEAS